MSKVEHLAADVSTVSSLARLFEVQIRELREGDLSQARPNILRELSELRDHVTKLIDKWNAKLPDAPEDQRIDGSYHDVPTEWGKP